MFTRGLIELIAPKACLACERPGESLCLNCLRSRVSPRSRVCYLCYWGTSHGQVCIGCWRSSTLDGTTVVARYDGVMRDLVISLKSHNDRWAAEVLGAMIARGILRCGRTFQVVTAVPTSPGRYRQRGYNPAELIAKAVASNLELPYRPLLLRLTTTHQIGQNRAQRWQQIRGAFYVPRPTLVQTKAILVVDDILTTGATLEEVARTLRAAGAVTVWAAAVARH